VLSRFGENRIGFPERVNRKEHTRFRFDDKWIHGNQGVYRCRSAETVNFPQTDNLWEADNRASGVK
jgi:hypothetical protein